MSKFKFTNRVVKRDAMLEYCEPVVELTDADFAYLSDPDDVEVDEDGFYFSRSERDAEEQSKACMRGPTAMETVVLIKQRAEEEFQKMGMPAFDQKVWISMDAPEVWEPAGENWKLGIDAANKRFGADGLGYARGRFKGDHGSPGWKWIELLWEVDDFLEATDPEARQDIALYLGRLLERYELHSKLLGTVEMARAVREGGINGAKKVNESLKEGRDQRMALIRRYVEIERMTISDAARKLERRGLGTFEANRKLYLRRK